MEQHRFDLRGLSSLGGAAGDRAASPRRPRWARVAVVCFFVVFVALQALVPLFQLLIAPRPARFGWQMFSISAPPPDFAVVRADGSSAPVAIESYVASFRGDVPLAQFLPAHLCRVVPGAVAVRVQPQGAQQAEVHQCTQ
jgi:hypothetical protein